MRAPSPETAGVLPRRLASLSVRRAWWVVVLFAAVTLLAVRYTVENLKIETDRESMISADLPFKKDYERLKAAFPRVFTDRIVVVLDADTPERAEDAARALVDGLSRHTTSPDSAGRTDELFRNVSLPPGQAFFERNGLLYLDLADLESLGSRLAQLQPFLGRLSRDPSVHGLFQLLASVLDADRDDRPGIHRVLARVAEAVHGARTGERRTVSWQELMNEGEPTPADRRRFVLIEPVLDYSQLFPAERVIEAVRGVFAGPGLAGEGGVRMRLTGGAVMDDDELRSVTRGSEVIAAVVLGLVSFLLVLGLRSLRLVLVTVVTLCAGLALSAAAGLLLVGHFNLISVAFAALYLGLGVDYAIHFCLRYQQSAWAGESVEVSLENTAGNLGGSLAACTATTALAFYAFAPTSYAGVSELGVISGTGMLISLVVTFTLLPALIRLMPLGPRHGLVQRLGGDLRMPAFLAELPFRHARAVRLSALAVGVAALALIPSARFDYNPLNLSDPESESIRTFLDLQHGGDSPPWSLGVLAPDEASRDALELRLEALGTVRDVRSLGDFVPDDQDEKLDLVGDLALMIGPSLDAGAAAPERGPEASRASIEELRRSLEAFVPGSDGADRSAAEELAAELGLLSDELETGPAGSEVLARLEDNLFATLPRALERLRVALDVGPIREQDLPEDLVRDWVGEDGVQRLEILPRGDLTDAGVLRRFVTSVQTIAPSASDSPAMMLGSGRAVVRAFQEASVLALAAIGIVLFVLLRSLRDSVLVLIPLVLAGTVTGASTVLLHTPFNHANVIALPLLLGIGVDSGIHMVHRARNPAFGREDHVRSSTARGILFSVMTTLCSFGALSLSSHRGTASLGVLLSIGSIVTLVATLVVLPALLTGARRDAAAARSRSPDGDRDGG